MIVLNAFWRISPHARQNNLLAHTNKTRAILDLLHFEADRSETHGIVQKYGLQNLYRQKITVYFGMSCLVLEDQASFFEMRRPKACQYKKNGEVSLAVC